MIISDTTLMLRNSIDNLLTIAGFNQAGPDLRYNLLSLLNIQLMVYDKGRSNSMVFLSTIDESLSIHPPLLVRNRERGQVLS